MRPLLALATLALTLGAVTAVEAAAIDNGTYTCTYYDPTGILMSMGDIEISGNSYRGPAYNGNYQGSYDYELLDSGNVIWRGPLGGLTSDGTNVGLTMYENDVIVIQLLTAGGNVMFLTCS